MTANFRILVAQVELLRQQHRAGITPPYGALEDLFDTALMAKQDLVALDAGMRPEPVLGKAAAPATVTPLTFERVADVRLPGSDVARFAKALLDALDRSTVTTVGPRGSWV